MTKFLLMLLSVFSIFCFLVLQPEIKEEKTTLTMEKYLSKRDFSMKNNSRGKIVFPRVRNFCGPLPKKWQELHKKNPKKTAVFVSGSRPETQICFLFSKE